MSRSLERITATTDVHSQLGDVGPMLAHLHRARETSLIVDCGDFFEGTGYYRLGGGEVEQSILTSLYDVLAPGNHGWKHHFLPHIAELTVCANAVESDSGKPLFRQLHLTRIAGRSVAVTAVISPQAFYAIPLAERAGHDVTDPAAALRRLLLEHHHEVDSWVLLSHSGFEADMALADSSPFLDVIFAGHCHSAHYAPEPVGNTLVVKGAELAAGYAITEPVGHGWAAHTRRFAASASLPAALEPVGQAIEALHRQLAAPLGPVAPRWRHRTPDRRELLTTVAGQVHAEFNPDGVILNETALRSAHLGDTLTLEDLLASEPFGNELVHVRLPEPSATDLPHLLAHLTERAGPLVFSPDPLPTDLRSVVTTRYLAEVAFDSSVEMNSLPLARTLRDVLTVAQPTPEEGAPA